MSDDVRASGGEPARDLAPSERLRLIARAVKGLFYERDGVSGRMIRSLGQEDSLSGIASSLDEWISLVVEEDRPRLVEAMRAAKERGESYETEYRLRHPDGRLLHVRDRAVVQGAGARRPARIVGFLTDVTAQRLAEARAGAAEELRIHSERRYRLLAENSIDVTWTFDLRAGLT
jgi:PAS domain-containing protein